MLFWASPALGSQMLPARLSYDSQMYPKWFPNVSYMGFQICPKFGMRQPQKQTAQVHTYLEIEISTLIDGLHLMKYLHSSNLAILHPLALTILASSNLGISYFTALWISDVSSPCIPQSYCIWICCVFCVWGPVWAGVFVGFANSGPRLSACCRAVL